MLYEFLEENQRMSADENNDCTYVVPTRDSAPWIEEFIKYYKQLSIDPLFILDSRSCDGTEEILRSSGCNFQTITPKFDRVEAMLSSACEFTDTKWVIRIDDDEAPSSALVDWVSSDLQKCDEDALWLSRREVLFSENTLVYSRLEDYYVLHNDPSIARSDPLFLCPQLRAFQPEKISFLETIHSPGIETANCGFAPSEAYFCHFDWIIRSIEQRKEKMRRYEKQSPGGGWAFAKFYLPELHNQSSCRWTPLLSNEFNGLATRLRNTSQNT